MDVEIRAAREDEIQAVIPLYDWLFAPPGAMPPSWDERRAAVAVREAISSRDSIVLVADAGGQLVGFCTVWVEDLAVDPGRRSQGVGKLLLDAAKDWARARGATHLELDSAETRGDAHRFYEREGPSWRSVCFAWEV